MIDGQLDDRMHSFGRELEREDPILYLNSDHERVRAALDSKGTTGRRARMRDLVFERIAVGVWSQLIVPLEGCDFGQLRARLDELIDLAWDERA